MGQKVHPYGFRLGVIKTWNSKWFEDKAYAKWLHEDIRIKRAVKEYLLNANIASVEVERAANKAKVVVYTARALSRPETKALEAYAEAIVLKDGSSVERLLDEVRLFVRRFQSGPGRDGAPSPGLEPAPPDVRFEGRKVLVVDDDMRTVYALSATLRAKGIEVIVADTGRRRLRCSTRAPTSRSCSWTS